jgi:hypothetical protein
VLFVRIEICVHAIFLILKPTKIGNRGSYFFHRSGIRIARCGTMQYPELPGGQTRDDRERTGGGRQMPPDKR